MRMWCLRGWGRKLINWEISEDNVSSLQNTTTSDSLVLKLKERRMKVKLEHARFIRIKRKPVHLGKNGEENWYIKTFYTFSEKKV